MKQIFYGAAALAAMAVAPGIASAQYYGYAPQPYYGAPAYQSYPTAYPTYNVPPGYVAPSTAPAVDYGQASASAHAPSYSGQLSTERSH